MEPLHVRESVEALVVGGWRRIVRAGAALALALALIAAPETTAQERQTFDIAEQSLSSALIEYSRRTGVVVVAPSALLAGKRAPRVEGALTAEAALLRLLAGSGLAPRREPGGGVALVRAYVNATGASTRPPQPPLDDIVITGPPPHALALAYATAISGDGPAGYETWPAAICPRVAGLSGAGAQALIDHLAERAASFGVQTGRTGCQPNVVIIFAADAARVTREIVETRRDLLGYYRAQGVVAPERARLEAFANSTRAVRWWHVATYATADGERLNRDPTAASSVRIGPPRESDTNESVLSGALEGVEAVRSPGTRMRRTLYPELSFALVVVDAPKAGDVPARALADYLVMVALARIDSDADVSFAPSILNLFSDRAAPPASSMTSLDLAYLQALYSANRSGVTAARQRAEIVRLMTHRTASN